MTANVSVDFNALTANHFPGSEIRRRLKLPKWINETCCVQISYALNNSGSEGVIGKYAFPVPGGATGKVRGIQIDGQNYLVEVGETKIYLNNRYGDAENFRGPKSSIVEKLAGRTGIMTFGHRHIDIWVGTDTHLAPMYNMNYLWSCESLQRRGVFFWEVTSPFGF